MSRNNSALYDWISKSNPEYLSGGNIDAVFRTLVPMGLTGLANLGYSRELTLAIIFGMVKNPRRKLSTIPAPELLKHLLSLYHNADATQLYNLRLERGIYYRAFEFLLANHPCKIGEINPNLRLISSSYKLCFRFRERLIHSYARFALKQANYDSKTTGLQVSMDDLLMNYLSAVGKAVDKYDPSKGALASFVQNWVAAHRTDMTNEVGVAYYIPKGYKSKIADTGEANNSVELDSILDLSSNYLPASESKVTSTKLATAVLLLDPTGLLALSYDLDLSCLGFTPKTLDA